MDSDRAINTDLSEFKENEFDTHIDIPSTSLSYTAPSDGYIVVVNNAGSYGSIFTPSHVTLAGAVQGAFSVFLRKGTVVELDTVRSAAYFVPLK